jgi:hypothetical protein
LKFTSTYSIQVINAKADQVSSKYARFLQNFIPGFTVRPFSIKSDEIISLLKVDGCGRLQALIDKFSFRCPDFGKAVVYN